MVDADLELGFDGMCGVRKWVSEAGAGRNGFCLTAPDPNSRFLAFTALSECVPR